MSFIQALQGLLRAGDPYGEVRDAWYAKEGIPDIYQIGDPQLAAEFTQQLSGDLQDRSLPLEVNRLGRTIARWATQIMNTHTYRRIRANSAVIGRRGDAGSRAVDCQLPISNSSGVSVKTTESSAKLGPSSPSSCSQPTGSKKLLRKPPRGKRERTTAAGNRVHPTTQRTQHHRLHAPRTAPVTHPRPKTQP